MMNNRLYVIGNGFDLHHEMKTSYLNFRDYLKEEDSELFDNLEQYIITELDSKNGIIKEDIWSNFEENLAKLDADIILSDYSFLLPDYEKEDLKSSDFHRFRDKMEEVFDEFSSLNEVFNNFITKVIIPEAAKKKLLELRTDAQYLTFNYTPTLEKLYEIPNSNILYIHGKSSLYNSNIILGHGTNPKSFQPKEKEHPDGLSEEELDKWYAENDDYDYPYTEGKEIIYKLYESTFKNTKEIIQDNSLFFENLKDTEEVFILGHSLGDVDLPYFEEIAKNINVNSKWKVSIYNPSEIETYKKKLLKLGIEESNIDLIKLEDLQVSSKLQLKINFHENRRTHINRFFKSESLFL